MEKDDYQIKTGFFVSEDDSLLMSDNYLSLLRESESQEDRIKSLEFHIDREDYFSTLATVLDLLRQGKDLHVTYETVLGNITQDLIYLQKKYKIVKK